jgi:hypothetical protein
LNAHLVDPQAAAFDGSAASKIAHRAIARPCPPTTSADGAFGNSHDRAAAGLCRRFLNLKKAFYICSFERKVKRGRKSMDVGLLDRLKGFEGCPQQ